MPTILSDTVPIKEVVAETPDTVTLRLDAYFDYKPGQFIQVLLPGEPIRSYSFSSSPTEKGHIDITVKAEPGGQVSARLAGKRAGESLPIKGPFGVFGLPNPPGSDITYLGAGSGVTPFRAMAKFLLDTGAPVRQRLFYSIRTPADAIFGREFQKWAGDPTRFAYIPTITRGAGDTPWAGETGRLSEAMIRKHHPTLTGAYFICGAPAFVSGIETLLKDALGISAERIHREKW